MVKLLQFVMTHIPLIPGLALSRAIEWLFNELLESLDPLSDTWSNGVGHLIELIELDVKKKESAMRQWEDGGNSMQMVEVASQEVEGILDSTKRLAKNLLRRMTIDFDGMESQKALRTLYEKWMIQHRKSSDLWKRNCFRQEQAVLDLFQREVVYSMPPAQLNIVFQAILASSKAVELQETRYYFQKILTWHDFGKLFGRLPDTLLFDQRSDPVPYSNRKETSENNIQEM